MRARTLPTRNEWMSLWEHMNAIASVATTRTRRSKRTPVVRRRRAVSANHSGTKRQSHIRKRTGHVIKRTRTSTTAKHTS